MIAEFIVSYLKKKIKKIVSMAKDLSLNILTSPTQDGKVSTSSKLTSSG